MQDVLCVSNFMRLRNGEIAELKSVKSFRLVFANQL